MTLYPGATWRPCANHSGPMSAHLGLILHVQVGTNDLGGQFNDPNSQSSYTWDAYADGHGDQFVDADLTAWAQGTGNDTYNSVGTQGFPEDPLTEECCVWIAALYRWGHDTYGWPYVLAENPGDPGFGWHGMGGQAWGGHEACLPLDITEVLTPTGWLPLCEVTPDSEIASWSADSGLIDFGRPIAITPTTEQATVTVAGLEMTADHRLYLYRSDVPNRKVLTAGEVGQVRTNWLIPAQGQSAAPGCGAGPDVMRLLVWVQADAHYNRAANGRVEAIDWHLAKLRKVDRIAEVLGALGKDFTLHKQGNGTWRLRVYGQDWIAENVLRWLPEKMWGWGLLDADPAEFAALDEEIVLADGYCRGTDMRTYCTTPEINADVVQALYVTHGRSAAKHRNANGWQVQLHMKRRGHATRDRSTPGRTSTPVGCVTTHNDTLLIRQNGRVAIVGNCPGDLRRNQRQHILDLAQGATPPPAPTIPQEDDMPTLAVRRAVMNPDGSGDGYTLDAHGGIWAVGNATPVKQASPAPPYWPDTGAAVDFGIVDWSKPSGWTLDCLGAVHGWGGYNPHPGAGYWPNAFVPPAPQV